MPASVFLAAPLAVFAALGFIKKLWQIDDDFVGYDVIAEDRERLHIHVDLAEG